MDNFPEELREVVHDHWTQFPPQHPLVVDMFGLFFLFLTFICLFGNGLVIYVFLSTKSLRTPTNMFIGIMFNFSSLSFILTSFFPFSQFGHFGFRNHVFARTIDVHQCLQFRFLDVGSIRLQTLWMPWWDFWRRFHHDHGCHWLRSLQCYR